MLCNKTLIRARKLSFLSLLFLLLTITVFMQQKAGDSWQTYSPVGTVFSIQVPGNPLPSQGIIFDPSNEDKAYRAFEKGIHSRIYHFELNKGDERQFQVSIIEVQIAKSRSDKFIKDSEVKMINMAIGDGIVNSKVVKRTTKQGQISNWSYKRKGGLGDDDEEDGTVYVKSSGVYMVIVVVDYDYIESGDTKIKTMLDSLTITKN